MSETSPPDVLRTLPGIRRWRDGERCAGRRVALVATMGNLHRGHLDLVRAARENAETVLVSIFVNPTQFAPGEDYARYPRTLERDLEALVPHAVDAVFAPAAETVYPHGGGRAVAVEVPGLSDVLCGAIRPGHFRGVASVMARLFNLVEPDVAAFGEKDYQQLLVVRRMAEELFFRVEVLGVPTTRESDGLAMSSRNAYLTAEERQRAPALHAALAEAGEALARSGDFADVEAAGRRRLEEAGMRADYFAVRRADDLGTPVAGRSLVVLAAAWLGRARLIDNVRIDPPPVRRNP